MPRYLFDCGLILILSAFQRQWTQKADLLREKIKQLSRDERNKDLSELETQPNAEVIPRLVWSLIWPSLFFSPAREILELQMEVERLRQFMSGETTVIDSRLKGKK